ncbi:MAG: hypothetical protein EG825_05395 [Rhodocyclaceae bacterium]|nr:hypothetical protein [Rhodocyclaceae bacterium]
MSKVVDYNGYVPRDDFDNRIRYIEKQDYLLFALYDECKALVSALECQPVWSEELAATLSYYLFYDRLDYFWHTKATHFRNGEGLSSQEFDRMTNSLAYCFMLGWIDEAIYQGYLIYAVMNQGFQFVDYGTQHKHAHAFMLRLFADWRGDVSHPFLEWAYEVPLYEGLLERWREPGPDAIKPWLQAACEHHAHEAKKDTSRTFFDFGDFRIMRTPLEIHMILRLRELEGLKNPHIDHELMAAPFDVLLPPQPVLSSDEMMLGTLKRVREDWPDFDQVTALETLKAIPPKPWRYTTEQARMMLGL